MPPAAPRFYLTGRQPLRPEALLLAVVVVVGGLSLVGYGLGKTRHARFASSGESSAARSPGASGSSGSAPTDDDKDDDPSQIDTIVLGDAGDAPVPARKGTRISNVHATVIVHLPRFGQQVGLIPDSPAGHLLYGWLAAFNQSSYSALSSALPNDAPATATAAQLYLRGQTGGFNLLSAREVQPGVLVFRLRDQTPEGGEVLGTLLVRPGSSPPEIGSFSLRAVPVVPPNAPAAASPAK